MTPSYLSPSACRWIHHLRLGTTGDAAAFVRTRGWTGFGFGAAHTGEDGVANWFGVLAYDAGAPEAAQAAFVIAAALQAYPCLDIDDLRQREYDAAADRLQRRHRIPADLVPDVIRRLRDRGGLCPNCTTWAIDTIMTEFGHCRCADWTCEAASRWIRTTTLRPLHLGCADTYARSFASRGNGPAVCDCMQAVIHTQLRSDTIVTLDELDRARESCEVCGLRSPALE
jgi:hypothetical protein